MHNFHRLVTRWEYHIENLLGFVQLAGLLLVFEGKTKLFNHRIG